MNQPAHPARLVFAPSDRDESLPQTLAADVHCVVKHLALHLGRALRTRLPALRPHGGIEQVGSLCNVRPSHTSNLG